MRIAHRKTKPPIHPRVWKPMVSVPQDGVWFDLLCQSRDGVEVEVKKLRYISSRSKGLELRGEQNLLSPYLEPKMWDYHRELK